MNTDIFKRKKEAPQEPVQEPVTALAPETEAPDLMQVLQTLLRQTFEEGVRFGRQQAALERSQARPMENGAAPGGVVTATDPAHLSRAQRREIRDRVRRGEQVKF